MPLRKFRSEISDLVAAARTQAAFLLCRDLLNPESQTYINLIVAESAFNQNCADFRLNLIKREDYNLSCAQAAQALLYFVNNATKEELLFPNGFKTDVALDKSASISPVVRDSRKAHWHIMRAKKFRKSEQFDDCVHELRQAIALKPHSIKTKTDLAAVLRLLHEYNEAIDILENILKNFPRDSHSRNELASCYREKYDLDTAKKVLYDGLHWVSTNNYFHTNLFYIHLFFDCDVQNAVSIKKKYSELTNQELIWDSKKRQQYENFIHYFDVIHSANSSQKIVKDYLTECIVHKRAYRTAEILLQRLLKSFPNHLEFVEMCQKLPPQYRACFN